MKLVRNLAAYGSLLLLIGSMAAQEGPLSPQPSGSYFGGLDSLQAVAGQPLSADQITETLHTLPNGVHIRTKLKKRIYRDAHARIRLEEFFLRITDEPTDEPQSVQIFDPVAGVIYEFSPRSHAGMREGLGHLPPTNITTDEHNFDYYSDGEVTPAWVPPPLRAPDAEMQVAPSKMLKEPLGSDIIDGIQVTGLRKTASFPPDALGNEAPLIVVTENWTSPELRVTILSKTMDPRSGVHTRRLTNIDRSVPDAALFQPPPGYKLRDR